MTKSRAVERRGRRNHQPSWLTVTTRSLDRQTEVARSPFGRSRRLDERWRRRRRAISISVGQHR
jgi:hypothetical protein